MAVPGNRPAEDEVVLGAAREVRRQARVVEVRWPADIAKDPTVFIDMRGGAEAEAPRLSEWELRPESEHRGLFSWRIGGRKRIAAVVNNSRADAEPHRAVALGREIDGGEERANEDVAAELRREAARVFYRSVIDNYERAAGTKAQAVSGPEGEFSPDRGPAKVGGRVGPIVCVLRATGGVVSEKEARLQKCLRRHRSRHEHHDRQRDVAKQDFLEGMHTGNLGSRAAMIKHAEETPGQVTAAVAGSSRDAYVRRAFLVERSISGGESS